MSQVGLSIKLTADAKGVRAELAGTQADLTKLSAAGKGGAEGLAKVGQSADKTAQSLDKTATATKGGSDGLAKVGQSADKTTQSLDKTATAAKGGSDGLAKIGQSADKIAQSLDKTATVAKGGSDGLAKVGQSADKTAQGLDRTATATKGGSEGLARVGQSASKTAEAIKVTTGQARELAAGLDGQTKAAVTRSREDLDRMAGSATRAARDLRATNDNAQGAARSLNRWSGALVGIAAAGFGLQQIGTAMMSVARAGDAMVLSMGRLKAATGSVDGARASYEDLYRSALTVGVAVNNTVGQFARYSIAARQIGATREEVVRLVEVVAKFGVVSGTSTQEATAGATQLAQALASGRLQGDELRSILEAMPLMAESLARELGVNIGQLREMGAAGELTADKVFGALLRSGADADRLFNDLGMTMERAAGRAAIAWERLQAEVDQAVGLSAAKIRILEGLTRDMETARKTYMPSASDELAQEQERLTRLQGQRRLMGNAFAPDSGAARGVDQGIAETQKRIDVLSALVELEQQRSDILARQEKRQVDAAKREADLSAAREGAAAMSLSLAGAEEKAATARAERLRQIDGWVKAGLDEAKATGLRAKAEDAYRAAMDKAAEAGKKKNKVTEQAASKLDALMQAQQDDLRMAGLSVEARAEEEAVLRASEAARQDYNEGLRDTPLLYAAEVEAIKQTVTATRTVTAERKAASEVAREAARESERAWKDYARDVAKTAEDISGDVSEALWDSMTDERAGQSALEWFKDWGRRLGIEMLKQNIILPITTQVVGSVPGLFGIEAPSSAAGGGAGVGVGDVSSLGNLVSGSSSLYSVGSWLGTSQAGQALGLSSVAASAPGSVAAFGGAGAAVPAAQATLTGAGMHFAEGVAASPWGIVGSLGASALGLGSGNAAIDGAAGMAGSIGGGMAGSAAMGASLGAAAGPIGAAIGAFIAIAASTLLKKSPTNAAAGVNFDPRTGEITRAGHANKGNSEENLQALTDGVVPAVTLAMQALERAGVVTRESITSMNFGNRDTTSFALSGGAMGTRTISTGSVGDPVDLVGDILRALVEGADAVPEAIRERLHLLDFSDPEGLMNSIAFIDAFEDSIAAMTRGSVDFASQIEAVAKQEIAQATAAVTKFQTETARLGLDTNAAADATRAYVEQLIGLREPAAAMSATEQAVAGLHTRFAALGPLLDAVGLTAEDAARGLEKALGALADGFDDGIERQILAITDPTTLALRDLETAFAGLRREAVAAGADLAQVEQLYALSRAEITAQAEEQRMAALRSDLLSAYQSEAQAVQGLRDRMEGLARAHREAKLSLLIDQNLSPLAPAERLAEAERQWSGVAGRAKLGDVAAMEQLPEISRQYLEIARAYHASGEAYGRIFQTVSETLEATESVAARHMAIADDQLAVMREQLSALGLINDSVKSFAEALAAYQQAVAPTPATGTGGGGAAPSYENSYNSPEIAASAAAAEAAYLAANPDVAAAVAAGQIASGAEHWQKFGAGEGRTYPTTGPINQSAANDNWAAMAAVNGGSPVGYDFSSTREVNYLASNPDVLQAWQSGAYGAGLSAAEAAAQHWQDHGQYENRPKYRAGGLITGGTPGVDSVSVLAMSGERIFSTEHSAIIERLAAQAAPRDTSRPVVAELRETNRVLRVGLKTLADQVGRQADDIADIKAKLGRAA